MSKELTGIIQPKNEDTVWRYMSFEKFANILATGSLFFTRADKYDDKFEGYIPESTTLPHKPEVNPIVNRVDSNFRQYIMCNCWHHGEEESMAMWDKYHLRNSGIAIKTTMGNLKNSLPDKPNVFIGKIKYINNHNQIEMPIDVENFLHSPYFKCLSIRRILLTESLHRTSSTTMSRPLNDISSGTTAVFQNEQ